MSRRDAARRAVHAAVVRGQLVRPSRCEACGQTAGRIEFHHWSYRPEHWIDVIPLCRGCHGGVHSGRLVEPRTGRVYDARPRRVVTNTHRMLGRLLQRLRIRRPVGTMRDHARALGVSLPVAVAWERGEAAPPLERLLDLYDATDRERAVAWHLASLAHPHPTEAA